MGGTGGTCAQSCTDDANCHLSLPGSCATNKCDTTVGCCTTVALPVGTMAPAGLQTAGDCQVVECDGTETGTMSANDPTDTPMAAGQCDQGICSGSPALQPAQQPVSGTCTANGGKVCGDPTNTAIAGKCVGCNSDADCTDPNFPGCSTANVCVAPSCKDGIVDGNETDVDCGGGTCPPCADGDHCKVGVDCKDGVCALGTGTALTCQAPTCSDGVQNGNETGVDCGGGTCLPCGYNMGCMVPADCIGGICTGGKCAASCTDGVTDGMETDVDCGGPVCPACAVGKTCSMPSDCVAVTNGTDACSSNKCTLTCGTGWGDCDNMGDCNTNLNTTPAHCGACGTACSAYCVAAACNDPIAVSAGDAFTCAILADGTVWCWGYDGDGELGDGLATDSPAPKQVMGLPKPATAVVAGNQDACAILSDTTLWCWGSNTYGELGTGDTNPHTGPQQVTGLSNVSKVACGDLHACAVTAAGALYCWGNGGAGALGVGNYNDTGTPTLVSLSSVTDVTAGDYFTCAVAAGKIYCWGLDNQGQLGNGSTTGNITPGASVFSGTAVVTLAQSDTTCALNAGGVYCWGVNSTGQFGNGTTSATPTLSPPSSPALTGVTQLSVGSATAAAITSSGLYAWGYNGSGAVGDGTNVTPRTSPVKIGLAGAVQVSCGTVHTCALTSSHQLYCWGDDVDGCLGNGTSGTDTPVAVIWP